MFNRDNRPPELQNLFQPAPTGGQEGAVLVPPPAAQPMGNPPSGSGMAPPVPLDTKMPASGSGEMSIIGADLIILGEKITVMTKARLLVDGEVRGDINGREVIIGQSGRVTGTVAAHAIEVHGHVYGAVKARSVTLHPTSVVEGDIYNQNLRISEGAVFDGRVRRAKDAAEIEPILDPAQLQPAKG
ncbi:MAG: polymer-forming cytoskeletal protein [Hyphomicrobiaceae bacterium]|nr:polymer-forming cytoskeletal protein [Hyphomicrobiaceae bacterium]